jgi:Zn-dependent protease
MEPGTFSAEILLNGILWYLAFVLSTTLHEASHGFAAWRLGDRTAYDVGQVTLDPRPHFRREPVGMIVVPIISYLLGGWMIGWASVPYDREWAMSHPRRSATMSAAGPLANLALALLAGIVMRIGLGTGIFQPPESIDAMHVVETAAGGAMTTASMFVNVFFSLNVLLFTFNLLPIPPLDGSGIIPWFLSEETGRRYLAWIRNPSFAFLGLFIAWKAFDLVYPPLHLLFINILYFPIAQYH